MCQDRELLLLWEGQREEYEMDRSRRKSKGWAYVTGCLWNGSITGIVAEITADFTPGRPAQSR
jgi:hypothetical protein